MENQKTSTIIVEKLNGVIPTGEAFTISDENIKLTFEDGKEYATLPVWVLKEALNDYFSDQRKCNRNTSMIAC